MANVHPHAPDVSTSSASMPHHLRMFNVQCLNIKYPHASDIWPLSVSIDIIACISKSPISSCRGSTFQYPQTSHGPQTSDRRALWAIKSWPLSSIVLQSNQKSGCRCATEFFGGCMRPHTDVVPSLRRGGSAKASADNLDRPHCSFKITDSKSQPCPFLVSKSFSS